MTTYKMTKKEFTEIIKELMSLEKDIQEVDKALKKLDPDFGGFYLSRISTLIVKTLQIVMKDKADWIGYWFWELDCGKLTKKNSVQLKNGKNVPIKTISDLYKILTTEDLNT